MKIIRSNTPFSCKIDAYNAVIWKISHKNIVPDKKKASKQTAKTTKK